MSRLESRGPLMWVTAHYNWLYLVCQLKSLDFLTKGKHQILCEFSWCICVSCRLTHSISLQPFIAGLAVWEVRAIMPLTALVHRTFCSASRCMPRRLGRYSAVSVGPSGKHAGVGFTSLLLETKGHNVKPQFYGELKEKEVFWALNSWLKACSEVRDCPGSLKEHLISWGDLILFQPK